MRKGVLVTVAFLLMCGGIRAEEASQPFTLTPREPAAATIASRPPGSETVTIPAETEAAVLLLSGIHTQVSHVDDPIRAQLLDPIYVNGRLVLPPGTLLDGRITMVRSPGRMRRPAELVFRFETVMLPDGQVQPINAALTSLEGPQPLKARLDSEGGLKGASASGWKRIAGGLVALGAATAAGATMGGTAALSTVLPAGGTALFSYALFWPRGTDVHIPPDTRLRIRLNHSLTVRVPW